VLEVKSDKIDFNSIRRIEMSTIAVRIFQAFEVLENLMSAYFRLHLLKEAVDAARVTMSDYLIYNLCREHGFTEDEIKAAGLTIERSRTPTCLGEVGA
jgi:hypothetical protein